MGAPTPFQIAAVSALNFPADYYKNLQSRYDTARGILYNALKTAGFMPFLPQGSYYIIADYSELKHVIASKNDFEFSKNLIYETKIATVPGSSFYSTGNISNQVRFAFCKKLETLKVAENNLLKLIQG